MEPVFPFDLDLRRHDSGGLVHALHSQLRAAILDGRLAPGWPLPATRRVAATLGLARNTVLAAYDLLIAEGYVLPRRRAKAVVAELASRRKSVPVAAKKHELPLNPLWQRPYLSPEPPRELPARCFRLGIPEHYHFPHAVWRRLSARCLREWSRQGFSYPPTGGLPELREAIASHVAFTRAVACTAEDVLVTSGAQHAFDLLARLLVTPGETKVAVEDPGYPQTRAAFAAAGARLVPVPVDDEGLCVERLPEDVRIVAVTPSHQSPTGAVLSMRRRTALLDFARRQGAVLIEDDYDGEFRFGGRPLDALQTLDRDGRVFYVGTFSKSLFPALRKGFIVAPAWARDKLLALQYCTDGHADALSQAVLAAFIREGHLARHVRHMQPIYAERRQALLDGLRDQLGSWLEPIPSEAGLHLAARIRDPALAPLILTRARQYTPGAQSIDHYGMNPPYPPALSFGYGQIDAGDIAEALARFGQAMRG
ncbi:MAG: PLP-dependent aminotransferase family protein [Gammaproteobacteria bacterium]|nr:PLP-dependent aminotransferase family protein [Gammaproteobacteria bacterium]